LKSNPEAAGLKKIQNRIHKFIYYPILLVTILSGIVLAVQTGVFQEAQWIKWKMGLLVLLILLGIQNGIQIK
ncbi:MAG: hypothetical protein GWM98_28650, partial [Nitrospinaceae bacterium]|nr:hypothetical protein [Nitrospinaceae bacterium]NIR57699.1 hypothetical protein [Nitrospinaceae bacterium]NIS88163.1 hypothetical protein [Nitrospinaceae bacterium]NIT85041.1 hypothetical protein [Nitrospinaceae bacterium]NIU47203.1 hypothetical protein [Nitrospinaceae bacterium]